MSKTTPRLGKGLSTILGPRTASPFAARQPPLNKTTSAVAGLRDIPIDRITPNPRQPRTSLDDDAIERLARSIRSRGVLHPVLVRLRTDGNYELMAGERRWRAARRAGLRTIPALVRELSDAESLEVALIENLQREDLGVLDRAAGYQHYLDAFGVTVEELAQRLGENRATISNYLRIRRLAPAIQQMVATGALGMGQTRALAGIDDPQRQLAVARLAARRNLSVRQVEALARSDAPSPKPSRAPDKVGTRHFGDLERALTRALGLPVRLYPGRRKNSGRLVIRYQTLEEFDRIAEKLGAAAALE